MLHTRKINFSHAVCNQGDIRLQGGANNMTGRVEICNNQVWGTVCNDAWGAKDVQVACRQLGFTSTGTVIVLIVCLDPAF